METAVIGAIALLAIVAVAVVAACSRTVPPGTVALTSRFGEPTGVQPPGTFRRIPMIDSFVTVSTGAFVRSVAHRSETSEGLDVGVSIRVRFVPLDAGRFGPLKKTFDDRHEQIIRRVVSEVLASRTHDDNFEHRVGFAPSVRSGLIAMVGEFFLTVEVVELDEMRPTLTGVAARRQVGAAPVRTPSAVEVLELARRQRDAILHPPAEPVAVSPFVPRIVPRELVDSHGRPLAG